MFYMSLIFFIGLGLYLVAMALIGFFAGRRVKTMEDYLVAGRCLPFYLAVPTIVATWFGAGSSMGVSGTVYEHGFYGVIPDPFGCSLALILCGLFFAVPFRRLRLLTISDLLRNAYGPTFETASTLIVLPFYVGTLASQMLAMGFVYQIVCGGSLGVGIILGAGIVIFYTVIGGMWAVTLTDFVQFVLLTVGLIIILPICLKHLQDRPAVFNTFLNEFSNVLPKEASSHDWLSYVGRVLMTGLGQIMGQDLIQRILASRSEGVARVSSLAGALIYFALGLIPLYLGIAGRELYPELENPEHLIPLLAKDYLTPITFMIFACGLFAAIMSTADSYLLAGTSLLTNNVLLKLYPQKTEKSKIKILRWTNIGIACVALILAFSGQSIFNLMVHFGVTLFVGLFVPASMALFWKAANSPAAWSSMLGGMSAWLLFIFFNHGHYHNRQEDLLFSAATIGAGVSFVAYLLATGVVYLYDKFFPKPIAPSGNIAG